MIRDCKKILVTNFHVLPPQETQIFDISGLVDVRCAKPEAPRP